MIGSLMSRMADAEKLSVAQLNAAVKDGTIPAYVGVPLIQEKMKAQQAAQAMVAQNQAQPPVARQIMEQADAATGLEKLQSNLPEQGYAGGGIVAFADGGLAPDDEDSADEEKSLLSQLMAGISGLKSYEGMLAEKGHTPASIRSLMRSGPKPGDYVAPPEGGRGHKYEEAVAAEAKRQGLDPNVALHVLYKETGGLKNPESARSKAGALGVMQIMPKTAKDLGIDPLDPMDNIRGGVSYLKQMMDKYQDPVLATAAYNAGPGRVDKAIRSGHGIAGLPRETQMYVPRMADGGIVAFSDGGPSYTSFGEETPYDPNDPSLFQAAGNILGNPLERIKNSIYGVGAVSNKQLADTTKKTSTTPTDKDWQQFDQASALFQAEQQAKKKPTEAPPTVNPMGDQTGGGAGEGMGTLDDIKKMIKTGIEEGAKQKRVDTMLSLLTAGLGIMGGTSPYAAANIGQGGQQGVAAALAARKAQSEDQRGLLSAQLGLSRAELYEKMRRDALKQKAAETAFGQNIAQQKVDVSKSLVPLKQQELMIKTNKAWEESSYKPQLEGMMVKEFGKNWNVPGSKAEGIYKLRKQQWLRDNVVGGGSNIPTADEILANLNQ